MTPNNEAKVTEKMNGPAPAKEVFVIIGQNNLDGVYCHGVYEDWRDAMRALGDDPQTRRIRRTYLNKAGCFGDKPQDQGLADGRPS